jgi:hypothetical protein
MRYGDFFFLAAQRFRYQYARFNVNTADWRIKIQQLWAVPSHGSTREGRRDAARRLIEILAMWSG